MAGHEPEFLVAGSSGSLDAVRAKMRAKPGGVDIRLPGGLFLIVGVVGLPVIMLFPSYALNLFVFGFHMFHSEFIATTALFIMYLFWRRHLLIEQAAETTARPFVPEGSH